MAENEAEGKMNRYQKLLAGIPADFVGSNG